MICNKCLEEKDKMEFQTDNSYYCNSCIKVFGQPSLMQASQASDKSQTREQSRQQAREQLTIKYRFVQMDSDIENNVRI